MRYFINFSTEYGELNPEIYTETQLVRAIKRGAWAYEEEESEVLEFITKAVPGNVYEKHLICINLGSGLEVEMRGGDTVRCLKDITFVDGTEHKKDQILKVYWKDIDYFLLNSEDYERVEE